MHGEAAEQARVLERSGQAELCAPLWSALRDVATLEDDLPRVRDEEARDEVEERGLAGAVRSDDADDLALVQLDRHVVDRGDSREAASDAAGLEDHGALTSVGAHLRVDCAVGDLRERHRSFSFRSSPLGRSRTLEEDRTQQIGTLQQFRGEAVKADGPLLHEECLVGRGERDVHRLLDEDHRNALVLELLDDREELFDDKGREPEGELVDHEDVGLGEERHCEREHLLLAAGELCGRVAQPAPQRREEVQCLLGGGLRVLAVAAVHPQRDLEVLRHRERREHTLAAGNLDDPLHGDVMRAHPADVDALVADAAVLGRDETGDRAQHGGLAGAVRAQERDGFAAAELEADAEQHLHLTVRNVDGTQAEQVRLAAAQTKVGIGEVVDVGHRPRGKSPQELGTVPSRSFAVHRDGDGRLRLTREQRRVVAAVGDERRDDDVAAPRHRPEPHVAYPVQHRPEAAG
jgi:hypothetical protein